MLKLDFGVTCVVLVEYSILFSIKMKLVSLILGRGLRQRDYISPYPEVDLGFCFWCD